MKPNRYYLTKGGKWKKVHIECLTKQELPDAVQDENGHVPLKVYDHILDITRVDEICCFCNKE